MNIATNLMERGVSTTVISEFLINHFFGLASGFFELLPEIEWTVDTSSWDFVYDALSMIAFLLPWDTVTTITVLIIDISILRIAIAGIRALWNFIPFV